jgi:hypothetical protein
MKVDRWSFDRLAGRGKKLFSRLSKNEAFLSAFSSCFVN